MLGCLPPLGFVLMSLKRENSWDLIGTLEYIIIIIQSEETLHKVTAPSSQSAPATHLFRVTRVL